MLRVVLEFDHVGVAVRAEHELALRAAAHAPDVLDCENGQEGLQSDCRLG